MNIFLLILVLPVLLIAGTILLTLLVEFPIVYYSGITREKRYIVAVNALTNVCLNVGVMIVYLVSLAAPSGTADFRIGIWTVVAEAVLIPVSETVLYLKVSKEPAVKVLLITYLANLTSFFVGLIVVGLCTGEGFHGISNFFRLIFGG